MGLNGTNGHIGANGAIGDLADRVRDYRDGDRWEDPDWSLLHQGQMPAPALPLELFGTWASWIAAAARAASAAPDYVAFGLLTTAAALVGNACAVRPDPDKAGWDEPFALWTAIVGPPSSGKTPALLPFERALDAIEARNREDFEPQMQEYLTKVALAEQVDKAWQAQVQKAIKGKSEPPPRPAEAIPPPEIGAERVITRSATLEAFALIQKHSPKGVLQMRDELAGWIGDLSRYSASSDRPQWLSMYNAGAITMDRVKFGPKPLHIPRALASVLGGIQPDRLAELLDTPDDGFTARFIYVWPDPCPLRRSNAAADMASLHEAYGRLAGIAMNVDADGKAQPHPLSFTEDAATAFFEFRRHTRMLISNEEGALAGWIGKADGLVARLAGVLELLNWSRRPDAHQPRIVPLLTVERAITLWIDYLLPMARRAFGDAARPPGEQRAARLLKAIRVRRPAKLNEREVYKDWRLSGLRTAADVKGAVAMLEEAGWILPDPSRAGGGPGKQKSDWDINPELWR